MRSLITKISIGIALLCVIVVLVVSVLAYKAVPEKIEYGMSFNTFYAEELGLNPRDVYDAFLDELQVKKLRLAAHWTMVEPIRNQYDFRELDYQLQRAQEENVEVIFAVGRRLPRWPECHVPAWADALSWDEQKEEIRKYLKVVVNRYKDNSAIIYWQVENEPYLAAFAYEHCGDLDEAFLEEEIALVKSLDPMRPVLVTDSGNIGTWFGAYKNGDVFGTSMYIHLWTPELGQFRTIVPPWFYRAKENVMALLYGKKDTLLIELSAEPWLIAPLTEVDVEIQYSRMDIEKFEDIIEYAKHSRYDTQYLWGGEWWYWLKEKGHMEMWERGVELLQE